MADIELVIRIPEGLKKDFELEQWTALTCAEMKDALEKAILLPKDHGRLIDADELLKAIDTWDKFGYTETGCFVREPGNDYVPYVHYEDMIKSIRGAETIMEAESEDKE